MPPRPPGPPLLLPRAGLSLLGPVLSRPPGPEAPPPPRPQPLVVIAVWVSRCGYRTPVWVSRPSRRLPRSSSEEVLTEGPLPPANNAFPYSFTILLTCWDHFDFFRRACVCVCVCVILPRTPDPPPRAERLSGRPLLSARPQPAAGPVPDTRLEPRKDADAL